MRRGGETQVRGVIWRNKRARKELVGWRDTGDEAELTKLLQGGCGGGCRLGRYTEGSRANTAQNPGNTRSINHLKLICAFAFMTAYH